MLLYNQDNIGGGMGVMLKDVNSNIKILEKLKEVFLGMSKFTQRINFNNNFIEYSTDNYMIVLMSSTIDRMTFTISRLVDENGKEIQIPVFHSTWYYLENNLDNYINIAKNSGNFLSCVLSTSNVINLYYKTMKIIDEEIITLPYPVQEEQHFQYSTLANIPSIDDIDQFMSIGDFVLTDSDYRAFTFSSSMGSVKDIDAFSSDALELVLGLYKNQEDVELK